MSHSIWKPWTSQTVSNWHQSPTEPICHSDSSAHGWVRSVAESQSHVAAGKESISRSRCHAPPTADDNVCNYVLQCSRRLTSEGIKCPTPKIWNYVKTRVLVFLAAETEITKIYINIVVDVLCNKRCILLIRLVVRSWTVRTLGWQLESHSKHGLYNTLSHIARDAFLWIEPQSKMWFQMFKRIQWFLTLNQTMHKTRDSWIRNVCLFQVSWLLRWVAGLLIPDVSKKRTAFIFKC